MMVPMASTRRERGEAGRASQALRDLAVLLVLIILVFSIRFQADEAAPSVKPLPGGVQAAGLEQAEPVQPEPAAVPALATPAPAHNPLLQSVARLQELSTLLEMETRVLVLQDGSLQEIHLPTRFSVTSPTTECSEKRINVQIRS